MAHSFIAYIDEAGDEGLRHQFRTPGNGGGSSNWMSIGAVVWRASRDLDFVGYAKDIIDKLPVQKQGKPLHFKDLQHPQRIMAINEICDKPMRIVSVLSYKPTIPDGTYVNKNQLYHYLSRYLLERISWLCRDLRKDVPEGDGRCKIVFARRGGMSYPEFQNYLRRLWDAGDNDVRIHWPVIDIDGVEALDMSHSYGLQIADLAISGLNTALEPDFYGNIEDRFARSLRPMIYHRNGNYQSYGAKLVPAIDNPSEVPHLANFTDIFS